MDKVFSEYFSRKDNLFTRIDARIKAFLCICAIMMILISHTFYISFIIALLALLALLIIRVPAKIILLRLTAPFVIAFMLFFIKVIFYKETLGNGLTAGFRVIGSTSVIIFLSMTTPLDKLLALACWLRLPKIWIEICLISYRYIFVLLEDVCTVIDAQRLRLGYANFTVALRSIGDLAGAIIIRAYDQSIATYEAMKIRGYKTT